MDNLPLFRARYAGLQQSRPSVIRTGLWFSLVYFLSRLLFFVCLLGLVGTVLWAVHILEFDEEKLGPLNPEGVQTAAAVVFVLGMLLSGFSARMCRRVVERNVYIIELELLLEETVLEGEQVP